MQILHRRHHAADAETIGFGFVGQQLVSAGTQQLIEKHCGFDAQAQNVDGKFRHFERDQLVAELLQLLQRALIVTDPLRASIAIGESVFEIADAQLARVEPCIPIEWNIGDAQVLAVGACDDTHHRRAVFDIAANGTESILCPRQRHYAVATDAPECRTQSGRTTACARAQYGAAGLRTDRERNQSRRRCGRRSRR